MELSFPQAAPVHGHRRSADTLSGGPAHCTSAKAEVAVEAATCAATPPKQERRRRPSRSTGRLQLVRSERYALDCRDDGYRPLRDFRRRLRWRWSEASFAWRQKSGSVASVVLRRCRNHRVPAPRSRGSGSVRYVTHPAAEKSDSTGFAGERSLARWLARGRRSPAAPSGVQSPCLGCAEWCGRSTVAAAAASRSAGR